jgi:uncharacterized membrane protein YgcG
MKATRLFLGIAFLTAVVALAAQAQVSLRITEFQSEIELLQPTGETSVTETLAVTFLTAGHGIERDLVVSSRAPSGENLSFAVTLAAIEMDGRPIAYTTRRAGKDLVIRIGDPDRTVLGAHTYTIRYRVGKSGLVFKKDFVQLLFNVTGYWELSVAHTTALVRLPSTVDPSQVTTASYVGYAGSSARGPSATLQDDGRFVFETGPLSPAENLTINLTIPRAALGIPAPTAGTRVVWFLAANWYAAIPLVVLVGMFFLWLKRGKDPAKGTIAPRFDPPPGMDAGEAGVLVDDRVDLRDISAMVVDLAVRGHLKIKEVREEELGVAGKVTEFFRHSAPLDYEFVKAKPAATAESLSKAEQTVLDAMFDAAHPDKRTLSSLENEFYKTLPSLKSALYAALITKGYYRENPERVRRSYSGAGGALIAAGIGLGIVAGSLYLGLAIVVSGLIVWAFASIMPRKTRKGVDALQDLLGLAEYIQRAEVKQMEFHDAPEKSPALFEKLLPYAIALNLTGVWTKQFEGLLKEPPDWYVGRATMFNGHLFALSMLSLSSGMQRTFISAPRTGPATGGHTAWGGGGHFGGGFSGGGFGGGGGRGW